MSSKDTEISTRKKETTLPDGGEPVTSLAEAHADFAQDRRNVHKAVSGVLIPDEKKVELGSLRRLRGDDSAVKRLDDFARRELEQLILNPADHSREDVVKCVLRAYSGEEYGDYQWQKKIDEWGSSPERQLLYGKFCEEHPEFIQLSLDLGCMTYLREFMEMIENGEVEGLDPITAREKLKEKLGKEVVYRGMMLTEEELSYIKENGINSPLISSLGTSDRPIDEFEARVLSTDVNQLSESHFHGENPLTPFVSVSSHKDVAIAVGRAFGNKRDHRKFYLFKLRLPKIDLIHFTEHALKEPYKLRTGSKKLTIGVDADETTYDWNGAVESYVPLKIDPMEILEITRPNVQESSWNGRKIVGTFN